MILMVTASNDLTCDYLIKKYPSIAFFRLNTDQFSDFNIKIHKSGFKISSEHLSITNDSCKSIYFRKPEPENLGNIIERQYHNFAHREAFALIEGIVESFSGTCLSPPSIMRRANNKIVQLMLAKSIGFNIPESLITNSEQELKRKSYAKSIVKPIATGTVIFNGIKEIVQTNILEDTVSTGALKFSPAYFQEYLEKDYEIRATFVGEEAYVVRIDSSNKVDWRKKCSLNTYIIAKLPKEIYQLCLKFMRTLNMSFGCFDFIVQNDEFFFLEMNANGQWAWLEFETGLNISQGIVDYLNA